MRWKARKICSRRVATCFMLVHVSCDQLVPWLKFIAAERVLMAQFFARFMYCHYVSVHFRVLIKYVCKWQVVFALPCSCCRMSKIVFNLYLVFVELSRISLFAYGSIHQGHGRFSGKSRGKQCACFHEFIGAISSANEWVKFKTYIFVAACESFLNLVALNSDCIKLQLTAAVLPPYFYAGNINTGG